MAKIEDLIAQIPDERLRKGIAAEVKALKKTKKFGLVFEEHLPETVRLPRLPVKVGEIVALKRETGNELWRVKEIHKGVATCERAVAGYAAGKDATKEFPVADLVVVRSFGDPIYPALVPVNRVERGGPDKPWHLLINADNFHALQLLLYCYEGQVDVIYIDPPYNTGARDWKYNNDYVDKTDTFRHSKWLSMMKKRLSLAKRLLKPDGVLIVAIDENENHHLGMLLENLFAEAARQMITICVNPSGVSGRGLSRVDEQAFFCFMGDSKPVTTPDDMLTENAGKVVRWESLLRGGNAWYRKSRENLCYLYFINTQLLGKDKILTKEPGDRRNTTFWQTVANTIARAPQDFVLIIDEAHRGAGVSERSRTPIMQKFVRGSEQDDLPPVPLVLGMSATPQRFTELLGNTNRTQRPINIDPEEVRQSGLLKDLIVVHNPRTPVAGDLTLLEEAAKTWKQFTKLWEDYCLREREKDVVRPILVVQVEDGTENILTRTPLADVVRVIERHTGPLALNEIVHCFQDSTDLQEAGRIIRKLEASRIQDSPEAKVVLFKTALSTGWDCPRAEVMMSFRRAQDPTSIAQLVGRMIRTPLARRIGTNEVLDTVELFLPHYDAEALEAVLKHLRNPEDGLGTRAETVTETYSRNPAMAEVFEHLKSLPTYSISRLPKMSDIKRALRLAGLLVHEGLDGDADEQLRETFLKKLKELRDRYAKTVVEWSNVVREGGEIEVDTRIVAIGGMTITGTNSARLLLSEENIDQLFDAAGRILAAGEGLHRTFWKRFHDKEGPNQAKLELFAIVRQPETMAAMEKLGREEFDAAWKNHRAGIQKLPASVRARFQALIQAAGKPAEQSWELPEQIVEKKEGTAWASHLYQDTGGKFLADLNTWETEMLKTEMEKKDFVCWLRNLDRREWALCIPYEMGGVLKGFYPDFIIVRKNNKGFVVDVLEPHDDTRTDTIPKAIGLAKFAGEHGKEFGRLIIARKKNNQWQLADVNHEVTHELVRKMGITTDLDSLFAH